MVGCWFGPGHALLDRRLGAHVVAGGEHRPGAAEDDDAHLVVGLGAQEGVVELDEQAAVLGVARARAGSA